MQSKAKFQMFHPSSQTRNWLLINQKWEIVSFILIQDFYLCALINHIKYQYET